MPVEQGPPPRPGLAAAVSEPGAIIVTMIHTRALRAAGALACTALAACTTDVPPLPGYGHEQVVSNTERACSGAVGGGTGPIQSLAGVMHIDTGDDGRALAFVANGGATAATTVLRAYAPGIQRTVAVQDGRVVANLVTDQNGTRDADGDPVVKHNAVLVPVTDMAGAFTGTAWSASMEVAGRVVSTCGPLPADVPADAP